MTPQRIQRKRAKGWRMPPDTVSVCRPGKWGNPAVIGSYFMVGDSSPAKARGPFRMAWTRTDKEHATPLFTLIDSAATAVRLFSELAATGYYTAKAKSELRGKNLACFCALDQPCHADVLLELANTPPTPGAS